VAKWILIGAALLLVAGTRLPNLENTTVVYLPEPGCPAFTPDAVDCWDEDPTVLPDYMLQIDLGGGWVDASALLAGKLHPGVCVSSGNLNVHAWRACCCVDDASCCSEPATTEGSRGPCEAIFNVAGKQYGQAAVEKFNAAHPPATSPSPTVLPATPTPPPVPTPKPTPGPTAQPLPTMLPYLGACCFDLSKPWVCGLATESTCQAQGGVRWLKQTECSNQVCSPQ
jgi:hypothetical protein